MNVFDIIVLAILVALTLRGIWKGMVSQIVSVASYFICWIVATRFGSLLAPTIPVESPWNQVLAMGIVFIITLIAIRFALAAVEQLIKSWHLQKLNTLLGGALGFTKGLLLCIIITFFGVMVSETSRDVIFNSKSGFHLVSLTTNIGMFVPKDSYQFVHAQFALFQDRVDEAVPGKTPETLPIQSSETVQQLMGMAQQAKETTESGAGSLFAALSQWWNGTNNATAESGTAMVLAEVASVQNFVPPTLPPQILPPQPMQTAPAQTGTQHVPAAAFTPHLSPFQPQSNNVAATQPTTLPQSVASPPPFVANDFFIRQPVANVTPNVQQTSLQQLSPLLPSAPAAPSLQTLAPLTEALSPVPEATSRLPLTPTTHHVGSDLLLRNSTQPANLDTPARVFRP